MTRSDYVGAPANDNLDQANALGDLFSDAFRLRSGDTLSIRDPAGHVVMDLTDHLVNVPPTAFGVDLATGPDRMTVSIIGDDGRLEFCGSAAEAQKYLQGCA